MSDYYPKNYKAYHEKTFSIDPTTFLDPWPKGFRQMRLSWTWGTAAAGTPALKVLGFDI
jgi:hypothetical protein